MTKQPKQVVNVTKNRIACDGGIGGHPRVWLQIAAGETSVECPYCDCKFILEDSATAQ
ncbi:zinc-finger domain-containing protein [Amylibacter marinus]|uniref:Zinc-finger domain-containing protein n=1 Tax=Amylibacter marinus TaxID=1475483 RepID=A0ABQ5VVE1_9RHOB|nr:zinc-finger domain-containing protein [Amylibacter marinus]GLQ35230.1 zinc-finger domain-containing protein [Amylibacter marinus]